jgi:hypothetical protein
VTGHRGQDAPKANARTASRTKSQKRSAKAHQAAHAHTAAAFLEAFATYGSIRGTARALGCSPSTHYARINADPEYAKAFAEAEEAAVQHLESVAWLRATEGVPRKKFWQGLPIIDTKTREQYVEREYSDQLLMFLLRANRPAKYRERFEAGRPGDGDDWCKVITPPDMDTTAGAK